MASALATPAATENAEAAKPARRPLPDHLLRERIVHPASPQCPCCGGKLRKLREDIAETLKYVPARLKVIQHVREKFVCRKCEAIPTSQRHRHRKGSEAPSLAAGRLSGLRARVGVPGQGDLTLERLSVEQYAALARPVFAGSREPFRALRPCSRKKVASRQASPKASPHLSVFPPVYIGARRSALTVMTLAIQLVSLAGSVFVGVVGMRWCCFDHQTRNFPGSW